MWQDLRLAPRGLRLQPGFASASGVSALNPIVLIAMTVLMLGAVFASTIGPAWRASRVKASSVLRND